MNTVAESIAVTFILISIAVSFFALYMKIESVHNDIQNLMKIIKEQKYKQNSKGDEK